MEEWKECKLGDIVEIHRGASPRPIQKFIATSGMPWVKISDATASNSRFINSTKEFIIEDGISKSVIVNPEDLIVSNSATPGLPKIMKIKACIHDGWLYFSNYKNLSRDFLYYKFFDIQRHLTNLANGSVFQNLKTDIVKDFSIKLPPLPTQQKIAAILSSLDDKIELNNKINTNLEQQAQALFKNWFVDFEPFGGKMPEGWKVGKLSDIGTIVGGSTPSKAEKEYYTNNGIAWITPKDLSNDKSKFISHGEIDITELGFKNSSAIKMPKGTVLYSSRAPIGYIAIAKNEVTTNQGFKSVIPNKNIGNAYIYCFLKNNFDLIDSMASGSTFKEISGTAMKNVPVLIPDDKTLSKFQIMCETLFSQQELLENENRNLSAIRDTLLPKLTNGEIEVEGNVL